MSEGAGVGPPFPERSRPLGLRYHEELVALLERSGDRRAAKRVSELVTLLDFATTLNRSRTVGEILDVVLFALLGETGAQWAGALIRAEAPELRPVARRGRADPRWKDLVVPLPLARGGVLDAGAPGFPEALAALDPATPAHRAAVLETDGAPFGLLVLGPPAGETLGVPDDTAPFVEAIAVVAAACLANGRVYEQLEEANRRLSLKLFQLDSLFDITRELHRARDEDRVRQILLTSAMGQLLASRCLLVETSGAVEARGIALGSEETDELVRGLARLEGLAEPTRAAALADEALAAALERARLETLVPLATGERCYGILALGRRQGGRGAAEEDLDFLRSLAAQAATALDNLRLGREWLEKQRMDKELARAREIQKALLPDGAPEPEGWDLAGVNIPCLTVGGDYYDFLEGPRGSVGLVIADVSGKGTGPALLMATVQASLRALSFSGELELETMVERLNELVYRSSGASRYVTLFFAWLEPATGRLVYVNAGHCYPLVLRRGGGVERLVTGGPVVGLLPAFTAERGETTLGPGDLLVAYTDGLSETTSPGGEEYGEERIVAAAKAARGEAARDIVARLVSEVRIFAAEAGLTDDLTLLVAKRLER